MASRSSTGKSRSRAASRTRPPRKPTGKSGPTAASRARSSRTATAGASRGSAGGRATKPAKVRLLSGGNPQIAKADGDAPVQKYIAALPGWKRDIGRRVDSLITRSAPGVRKAVRWNSPMYGVEGQGWFLSFHAFTKYMKLTFFRGTSLRPVPPGASKHGEVRYLDVREDDELDEAQLVSWIRQAAALPGWGG